MTFQLKDTELLFDVSIRSSSHGAVQSIVGHSV